MAHKTTFLAGLIFLLSSLLFAQGEIDGPFYIIGDDGRLYIDHIPDTVTASYLAVIDDGWLKKLNIDNLELDTSNIASLYDYLNAKSDTGHVHDTRYYTRTNLSTSGQSSVHWNNITNEPAFITGVDWDEIGGDQSDIDVSGFNNDAGYLTELPSHDHDTRYPLKSLGRIGTAQTIKEIESGRNVFDNGMYT